jgi:hypothetical protein
MSGGRAGSSGKRGDAGRGKRSASRGRTATADASAASHALKDHVRGLVDGQDAASEGHTDQHRDMYETHDSLDDDAADQLLLMEFGLCTDRSSARVDTPRQPKKKHQHKTIPVGPPAVLAEVLQAHAECVASFQPAVTDPLLPGFAAAQTESVRALLSAVVFDDTLADTGASFDRNDLVSSTVGDGTARRVGMWRVQRGNQLVEFVKWGLNAHHVSLQENGDLCKIGTPYCVGRAGVQSPRPVWFLPMMRMAMSLEGLHEAKTTMKAFTALNPKDKRFFFGGPVSTVKGRSAWWPYIVAALFHCDALGPVCAATPPPPPPPLPHVLVCVNTRNSISYASSYTAMYTSNTHPHGNHL